MKKTLFVQIKKNQFKLLTESEYNNDLETLLEDILTELTEIKKVSDPAVADSVLDIETAIRFVDAARYKSWDTDLVLNALNKTLEILPEDSEEMTDRIQLAIQNINYNT